MQGINRKIFLLGIILFFIVPLFVNASTNIKKLEGEGLDGLKVRHDKTYPGKVTVGLFTLNSLPLPLPFFSFLFRNPLGSSYIYRYQLIAYYPLF